MYKSSIEKRRPELKLISEQKAKNLFVEPPKAKPSVCGSLSLEFVML